MIPQNIFNRSESNSGINKLRNTPKNYKHTSKYYYNFCLAIGNIGVIPGARYNLYIYIYVCVCVYIYRFHRHWFLGM